MGRNPNLDFLPVLAISGFLLSHGGELAGSPAWIRPVSAFGWWGVDLFFVLSGFLIARELFRESFSPSPRRTVLEFWIRLEEHFYLGFPLLLALPAVRRASAAIWLLPARR